MAGEADEQDNELLLTDDLGADTQSGGEGDGGEAKEPIDELEYPETFDEEAEQGEETPLVKKLRDEVKEKGRRARDLERENERLRNHKPIVRTPKPTMDSCDYDEARYEAEYDEWKANEKAADEQETAVPIPRNDLANDYQTTLSSYRERSTQLGKPDFKDAEANVIAELDQTQQSAILMAASKPAEFIYALGRSPQRLSHLASIKNPIKLAAEVARIEGGRTNMARKTLVQPDTPARGNAPLSMAGDAQLAKLEKEADRTGDRSALIAYRASKRAAA